MSSYLEKRHIDVYFKKISSALVQGSYDEALEYIVEAEMKSDFDLQQKHKLILFKLQGYMGIANYAEVINLAKTSIPLKTTRKNFRVSFLANLYYVDALRHLQKYEQATTKINELDSLLKKYEHMIHGERQELFIKFQTTKGKLHHATGNLAKAIELLSSVNEYYSKINDRMNTQQTLLDLANVFIDNNEIEKANKLCMKALAINNIQKMTINVGKSLYLLGVIAEQEKKYEIALSYYTQSLAINEAQGDRLYIARVLYSLGNVYLELGLFKDSFSSFEESYDIFSELNNIYEMTKLKHSMGELYFKLGDINSSLKNFRNALLHSNQIKNVQFIARENLSLSRLYLVKNDFNNSFLYVNENLKSKEKLNNSINGKSCVQAGLLRYIQNDYDEAITYFSKAQAYFSESPSEELSLMNVFLYKILIFDELHDYEKIKYEIELIKKNYRLTKAKEFRVHLQLAETIIIKNSERLEDKAQALNEFKTCIQDESLDLKIREYCCLQELRLLLFEYNLFPNSTCIEKIEHVINVLKDFSAKNFQYRLKAYSCRFESKLKLVQSKIDQSIECIEMAYLIAQSKAFFNLEKLLRAEYEELTERFSYWKLYLKRKKSKKKKIIQTIGFDTLIQETIQEKIIFYY